MDVVNEVVEAELAPPAVSVHILEHEVGAWIASRASNDARGKDSVVNLDVAESDILEGNKLICIAWRKGIEQASWTLIATTGL